MGVSAKMGYMIVGVKIVAGVYIGGGMLVDAAPELLLWPFKVDGRCMVLG